MEQDITTILNTYVSQTGIVNTLWNIFLAVSLAIIGYVYKDRTLMDDWKIKIGLSIGFVLFSFGNDSAIIRSQKILVAAANYLDQECIADDLALNQFLKSHTALSVTTMHLTHFVFSLCVLLAMWLPNIEKLLFRQNMVKTGTVPSDESTR